MLASFQGGWVGGYINNFPDDFKTAGHKGPCKLLLLLTCCTRSLAFAQQGVGGGVITLLTTLTLLAKMAVPFPTSTSICAEVGPTLHHEEISAHVFLKYIQWPRMTKCQIFISCRRLTPTRNKWTMMNILAPKKRFRKICSPRVLIFLWILRGQHDQAGTLRSFCHSDHVRCVFLPQLAALPDAMLNPAFS